MSDDKSTNEFNLGGTIETALSGNYELSPVAILQEAWKITLQNFFRFLPAVIILLLSQLAIFFVALQLQLDDLTVIIDALQGKGEITSTITNSIWIANFSADVLSAPLYAGVSLMAMSHAAGLSCRPTQIWKGFQFAAVASITIMLTSSIQSGMNLIVPLISLYLTMAFAMAILLVCEKKLTPFQALFLSFKATNKKLVPLAGIYLTLFILFVISFMFFGLGLIIVMPLFFNVKGILYRNMFGIKLQISSKNDQNNRVFNA